MKHHAATALLMTLVLGGLLVGRLPAGDRNLSETRALIPGYVDAEGRIHPEKLLSYIDALHRAVDADKAEGRIVQLEANLSQVVAALARTRQLAKQQTARAELAEALAALQMKRGDQLTENLKQTEARLASTRTALAGQTAKAGLLTRERDSLKATNNALVLSVRGSQATAAKANAALDVTQVALAKTVTARDKALEEGRKTAGQNKTLSGSLKKSETELKVSQASLKTSREATVAARGELTKVEQALKAEVTARAQAALALKKAEAALKKATEKPAEKKPADKKDAPKVEGPKKAKTEEAAKLEDEAE